MLLRLTLLVLMAGTPDDYKQAHVHLLRANDAFQADQVTEAIREYETAYRLFPTPRVFYNLGQAYEAAGRKSAALDAFEAYVAGVPMPKDPGTDLVRWQDARERASALRAELRDPPRGTVPAGPAVLGGPVADQGSATTPGKLALKFQAQKLGSATNVAASPLTVAKSPADPPRRHWSKWWLVGAGVLTAGVVATVFIVRGSSRDPCSADLGCGYPP